MHQDSATSQAKTYLTIFLLYSCITNPYPYLFTHLLPFLTTFLPTYPTLQLCPCLLTNVSPAKFCIRAPNNAILGQGSGLGTWMDP